MGHEPSMGAGWPALSDLVDDLTALRARIAAAQAAEARLLADAVDLVARRVDEQRRAGRRVSDADLPLREVSLELGMAVRVSDRTVQARMGNAWTLRERFPATLEAWEGGRIEAGHAWAIVHAGTHIGSDEGRARYERLVLEAAATESAGRYGPIARAIAASVDPEAAAHELAAATADRAVRVYDLNDGMARLTADLPAPLAYAVRDRLTQLAKAATTAAPAVPVAAPAVPASAAAPAGAFRTGGGAAASPAAPPGAPEPQPRSEPGLHPDADPALVPVPEPDASAEPDGGRTRVVTGPGPGGAGRGAAKHGTPAATEDRVLRDADPSPREADDTSVVSGASVVPDPRTLDQVRADMLAEMLLTATPSCHGDGLDAVAGRVQVTVPALALAGVSAEPALLAGHGPVDPAFARRLAARAPGWDRVFTDAYTGLPLAVDRYRPSSQLRRYLDARDERCRTPGCTMPAFRCDADHTIAAAMGGATDAGNLADFCRRHHVGKHGTAWTVTQLGGGVLEWTSPTGRAYLDRPPATVRFVPAETPPF